MTHSHRPGSPSRPARGRAPAGRTGLVLIDARAPDIAQRIGRHMFEGVAFAIDYAQVPAATRAGLQDEHEALMKAMQALARQRHRATLQ